MYFYKYSIIMRKSSHFDKSISHVMNYVISKNSPSIELCHLSVLLYVSFLFLRIKNLNHILNHGI